MRFSSITLFAITATQTLALNVLPRTTTRKCPKVWGKVAIEVQAEVAGCTAFAHQAIRSVFHDCISGPGCNGSLFLPEECARTENIGLIPFCNKIKDLADRFNVSKADMLQFSAAQAISACPLGPKVPALVGRRDSTVPAPLNSVPGSRDSLDRILGAFTAKGFNAKDVVALMGTHSLALQFFDNTTLAGTPLDSTPNRYDTLFYKETRLGTAPYTLKSDKLLSEASETSGVWTEFIGDAAAWRVAFTDAWARFAVIGHDPEKLKDCSDLVPDSKTSQKRQEFNAAFVKKMSAKFRV